ncbi:hypothetical protein FRACYDRAFT_246948 [Fragilariopsis cylindrus CCMP1102]|uniref:Uncharacterized protein n=1 Tax=Fragilariopsis cylindrus CCMP1102 TaxID=635003 RepID=A0A1E7EXE7_9STRA|nr:hypothetical protein FRACYDRAFT_246948 [Fragilariopsis cylindrus CCMP1102]|eukprot:OEU10485.1 hypothetical protein FRACYDRAFT_246948 [Fragilariopsis cylindrus CCMP1102]
MYKVPIRWYNLSLICIGWIPGPDFWALARYLGFETMVQFLLLLLLWQPISEWYFWAWKDDSLAKMLEARIRNRKVVGGKHNVLVQYVDVSVPDLCGVVLCNPFK